MSQRPRVSVIIPVRDKKQYLERCLDSIIPALNAFPGSELLIVDNGSTDGTLELLTTRYGSKARVFHSSAPTVSGVRNRGAADARGTVYCFLDSDCSVPPDYLERVVEALASSGAAAVGHKVSFPDRTWIERCWHNLHFIVEEGPARWLPGACFNVTAAAFGAVGGFREDLVSGEDIELAARLARSGFPVWSSPRLIITHLDNPDTPGRFYRKEVWRGQGIGASGSLLRNRVLVMAFVHLLLGIGGLLVLLLAPLSLPIRLLIGLATLTAVPAASVLFRFRQVRRGGMRIPWIREFAAGVVLYFIYYAARGVAALGVWRRRWKPGA